MMVESSNNTRRAFLAALGGGALTWRAAAVGVLTLRARSRPEGAIREEIIRWKPAETAIIICDMWDNHYCQNAARRVKAMAPRMNHVIKGAATQVSPSSTRPAERWTCTPEPPSECG